MKDFDLTGKFKEAVWSLEEGQGRS